MGYCHITYWDSDIVIPVLDKCNIIFPIDVSIPLDYDCQDLHSLGNRGCLGGLTLRNTPDSPLNYATPNFFFKTLNFYEENTHVKNQPGDVRSLRYYRRR